MMVVKTTTSIALRLINLVMPGRRGCSLLNDIVTGPRTDPFAGISVAVNLNDEAEMEFDPVKVISDDSGSVAEDVDIEQ